MDAHTAGTTARLTADFELVQCSDPPEDHTTEADCGI